MRTIFYFIAEALRGLYNAKIMSAISILTIALSLSLLAFLGITYLNVHKWVEKISQEVDMIVYIEKESADSDISHKSLIDSIRNRPEVEKCVYIDTQTAMNRFREMYGDEMLSAIHTNPLPASVELFVYSEYENPKSMEQLHDTFIGYSAVSGVQYYSDIARKVNALRKFVFYGAIGIFVFMVLTINFIISNTIKLTIYARKELLRNMYFVGATQVYIKLPFIIEGVLHGLIGACISSLIVISLRVALASFPVVWSLEHIIPLTFFIGVFLGCLGSFSAVRKFLQ